MIKITILVRELGNGRPDGSMQFLLPELPRVGDYISVQRPEKRGPWGEDLIVKHIWWRLRHPQTAGFEDSDSPLVGDLHEVFVECDPAMGPWSSDAWRDSLEATAKQRGVGFERFDVKRLSVRESEAG